MKSRRRAWGLLLVWLMLMALTGPMSAAERPNILILVSDDQGYQDAGFQGSRQAVTPHLDELARSGLRCTSGYVTFPVCSPSRAGMLTGRHQSRFGHENNPVYDPLDPKEGLPLTETLLPAYFRDAGYRTGWIGKWHLGSSPAHVPWARGFEESYGFIGGGHRYAGWQPTGRQYTLPLIRSGTNVTEVPDHLTLALGTEAAGFVRRHQDRPWLLYVPFNAPHTPHEPTPDRLERFAEIKNPQRRRYLAQVSLLDDAVGAILRALRETGQRERTLVFFFSDNGGHVPSGSDNGPLRGIKGTLFEGGIRVPFLVSWPARLPAGRTYDRPVSTLDILPTALAAAGIDLPKGRSLDGIDLLPRLSGTAPETARAPLFWRMFNKKSFAVRDGRWKLVWTGDAPAALFDLEADPGEKTDLAGTKPDVARRLRAAVEDWAKELVDPVFPGSSVKNEDWGPGGANQRAPAAK